MSTLINQRNFYLDEKLKINSTLKWEYSYRSVYYTDKPFDGTYVRFDCRGYEWILNGPETITCTSHGNYSATPPTCKKRPDRETDSSSSSKFMSGVYLYIPTYLPTTYYLPTYLPTYIPTYIRTYVRTYLPTYLTYLLYLSS